MPQTITIQQELYERMVPLAQQLNITRDELIERALEQFIQSHQQPTPGRVINQGDIYWLTGPDSDITHPHVVIQDNILNHSRITTVVVCALTSNLKRASLPGSVLIDYGEAHLPKASVVEAAKVSTVAKAQLGEYIGTLSEARVQQILAGMHLLQKSFLDR